MKRIIWFCLLVVSAVFYSCDNPTSGTLAELTIQTTKPVYHIDSLDFEPFIISTIIQSHIPESVEIFRVCPDRYALEIFRDSLWVRTYPFEWNYDCEGPEIVIGPYGQTFIGFLLWPEIPLPSGLFRLAVRYRPIDEAGSRVEYSKSFNITK